jgi:multidrug efflux pump
VGLNPQALFNQGVSLDDVRSAISNANVRKPQGRLRTAATAGRSTPTTS